jgi:hypothetical protein
MKDLATALAALPGTRTELSTFPSGSAMLDVWRSGRLFVMEYSPTRRFGVDEVRDGEGFLIGYRDAYQDFEPAAERLKQLVEAAIPDGVVSRPSVPPAPIPPSCDQTKSA